MADLRTDYKDDLLDTSVNTQRKYRQVDNGDGTVSFVDETVYTQNGDTFGASEVNQIHAAVNLVNESLNLDFSKMSADIQDVNTLLQRLGEKFFAAAYYLYKDGEQCVEWENGLYTLDNVYTLDGGYTLGSTSMSATVSTNNHCRSIVTKEYRDLSGYNNLYVLYNNNVTLAIDISSIMTQAYVCLSQRTQSNGTVKTFGIFVSSTKENFRNSVLIQKDIDGTEAIVNRVWLE